MFAAFTTHVLHATYFLVHVSSVSILNPFFSLPQKKKCGFWKQHIHNEQYIAKKRFNNYSLVYGRLHQLFSLAGRVFDVSLLRAFFQWGK